jgi:uncharacterized protein
MKGRFFGMSCADAFLTTARLLGVAVPVFVMLLVLSGCAGGSGKAGFVEDRAGILTDDQRKRIDRFNRQLLEELGIHLKTVILKDPELTLYTQETRRFLRQWLVTDDQQDNEFKAITRNGTGEVIFTEDRAVIRFPLSNRQTSPFFFRRGPDGWMLDYAAMNRILGFNHKIQWFFRTPEHDFMFAFNDRVLDRNGFPHKRP